MINSAIRVAIAVSVGLLLVLAGASGAHAATNQDGVHAAVNAQRAAAGLHSLQRDATLDSAAQEWAQQMSATTGMVHSTSQWRAARIPAGWNTNGENIAKGYPAASAVMSGWMDSPGHRANILRSEYTRMGVGFVASGNYWVQIFAGYSSDPRTAAVVAPPVVQKCPRIETTNGTSPVYRFWSDTKQSHFYTMSVTECDSIMNNYPDSVWKYERVAYNSFSAPAADTVPVYRFWSDLYQGHFYTASEKEKNAVIADYPDQVWKFERIAFHAYPTTYAGSATPVYRFWSNTKGHHFFTSSSSERDAVIRDYSDDVWLFESARFKVPVG